jgi:hypothetical protein
MEGLTEGRIVHFVLPDGPSTGEHRPAIVVRVWRQYQQQYPGYSNLLVFTDGTNDGDPYAGGLYWATSVSYSEEPTPRSWHWIERA